MNKRTSLIIAGIMTFVVLSMTYFGYENNNIVTTNFVYSGNRIPTAFDNYKIVHISDLHNKEFGAGQKQLLCQIRKANPDVIVITGDLIDRRRYDLSIAMEFVRGAIKIAPVFYVSGNHEAWSGKYKDIQKQLITSGVKVLDDQKMQIVRNGQTLFFYGLKDPDFLTSKYTQGTDTTIINKHLLDWKNNTSFKILLSHRPELFGMYVSAGFDLVFCGHAHGGQIRLPFIGAIVAPDQKIFPRYTSGRYNQKGTVMYVSRGLGNSLVPIRINNRPEIIVVTLKSTERH